MTYSSGESPDKTVFEEISDRLDSPTADGSEEYPLYQGYGVTAILDKSLADAVVVYADAEGRPGQVTHNADLSPSQATKVGLVVRFMQGVMLSCVETELPFHQAKTWRAIERSDGFAVPDHPHRVIMLRQRDQAEPPPPSATQLRERHEQWRIGDENIAELGRKLRVVDNIAIILDRNIF